MKHGFTLIELLAVIVILAIIALIAVPIFISVIGDISKNSEEESVKLYMDQVQKTIANYQIKNPNTDLEECEILGEKLECNDNIELKIQIKGRVPSGGQIKIKNNKIIYKDIVFEGKYYNKDENGKFSVSEGKQIPICKVKTGEISTVLGTKYECEVKKNTKYNFYVLSINSDDTINLIMDRNICGNGTPVTENNTCLSAWHFGNTNNNYGPDTIMTTLYNATKDWENVPDMIMSYYDENNRDSTTIGYTSIITDETTKVTTITGKQNKTSESQTFGNSEYPLKARLPMLSEVTAHGCHIKEPNNSNFASCDGWIVENLNLDAVFSWCTSCSRKYAEIPKLKIAGYWLLSSYANQSAYGSVVRNEGNINYSNVDYTGEAGIRPVITISANNLTK